MPRTKSTASRMRAFRMAAAFLAASSLVLLQGQLRADTSGGVAKATFQARCAICHGPDGGGSQVGKTMNVPDLRSPAIQKTTDPQLSEIIANGKNGMPSFKGSLSADQIHGLVAYVHTLVAKK